VKSRGIIKRENLKGIMPTETLTSSDNEFLEYIKVKNLTHRKSHKEISKFSLLKEYKMQLILIAI